jgi:RND superfamily putative drug exporter
LAPLADLALRRPGVLLAGNIAVLAVSLILAVGAPGRLGIGSLALGGSQGDHGPQPDLVVAVTGPAPVRSGPYRVALRVISSQLSSDPAVARVRRGGISAGGHATSLAVSLTAGDDAARRRAVGRIEGEIDPGPLRVQYGGEVATLVQARENLSGDLWKLELLAAPVALAVLVFALGPSLAIAPVLCAATAVAGALAGLRIAGAAADVSLLGIAPAAVLGLALGVEAPCLIVASFRDDASGSPEEAVSRAVAAMGRLALPLGMGAIAASAGLLAIGLDQAPSMVLAGALAIGLALGSGLICVPALLAFAIRNRWRTDGGVGSREPRLARAPSVAAVFLARSRARTALVAAVAVAVMAAAALPLVHADSRPLSAADLPPGSDAARAVVTVARARHGRSAAPEISPTVASGAGDGSLFGELPLAVAAFGAALALVLGIAFSPRAIPAAIVSLLPAAAACGLCVLVFQEGHLAGAIAQRRQGALETGAAASLLAAIASISAARTASAIRAAREERGLGLDVAFAAETSASLTVPATICATLVVAPAAAVLAGSDLYPAREFGLAVAVGLVIDLVLLRVPLLAALVRWGGSG